MKTIFTTLLLLFVFFSFGQTMNDTLFLQKQAYNYLTKMYIEKQYDSASVMWDKRVYLEMEDFYNKNNKGHLTDTTLFKKVKSDVYKYYAQLHKFTIDSLLGTTVEIDNGYKMGYVFYQYTHTLKDKTTSNKTMLVFISEDNGKTWVLQDWTVKWIADQVVKKMFE